jgi:hypothetical protein
MNKFAFSCTIGVSMPEKPLSFKITLDDKNLYDINTTETSYDIAFEVPDDDNAHAIKFILDKKVNKHTEMNDGVIIASAQVEINNISINDFDITEIILANDDIIKYTHNSNGYGEKVTVPLDFIMGHNGVAELKLTTPIHKWLLEQL